MLEVLGLYLQVYKNTIQNLLLVRFVFKIDNNQIGEGVGVVVVVVVVYSLWLDGVVDGVVVVGVVS